MAKIFGLFGSMQGKVADVVMAVRNGEQIVRKYQPVVYNPKTGAQVASRAKLKLASQLSAVMSPVIAIPRQGMVSSRNLFTKKNYLAFSFSNNEASVNLSQIQLTSSVVSMPLITASRQENSIRVRILTAERPASGIFNRVVYVALVRASDGTLRLHDSAVATVAGEDNTWSADMALTNGEVYFYAYAIRDNTSAATTIFGNLNVTTATAIASLIVTRRLTETDVTLTETVYYHLTATEQS